MILIADSGSTKTDWKLITSKGDISSFSSPGLNPVYLSDKSISEILNSTFNQEFEIKEIYFYGAGCMHYEKADVVKVCLESFFPNAKIEVNSDILGAARATNNHDKGLTAIMGTGANIAYYDGKSILSSRSGLGYILGDEGSGAHLGKTLIQHLLNHFLRPETMNLFENEFHLSKQEIIHRVYKEEKVSVFFASFTRFIIDNQDKKDIKSIIDACFNDFFKTHIQHFENYQNIPLNIVGSVGYYFKPHIEEIALQYGVKIGNVIQKPIEGLVKYHSV